jgi:hypothetical protein
VPDVAPENRAAPFLPHGWLRSQKLQGDEAIETGIFGLIDHSHTAAATEFLDDAVVGDGLVNHFTSAARSVRDADALHQIVEPRVAVQSVEWPIELEIY